MSYEVKTRTWRFQVLGVHATNRCSPLEYYQTTERTVPMAERTKRG